MPKPSTSRSVAVVPFLAAFALVAVAVVSFLEAFALVALVFSAAPAHADERKLASDVITDGGLGVMTATANAKLKIQCPLNVVYFRTGGDTGAVVDAGAGDLELDFLANPDAYPFTLRNNATKVYFRPKGSASATCNLFGVTP